MLGKSQTVFLMGNEAVAKAAIAAGAKIMFGYPITPTSEILEKWIEFSPQNHTLYLQTEDEMAAGFGVIGACLAGTKSFTATAGPGNVLMQDAFSMAEALRIPSVGIIMQRGGLSTSTVIYSQEEVTLTCFGGNGEGLRVVYSTSGLQDLYDYTLKAFATAWKYRFPTFVLGDGYQGKMKGEVEIYKPQNLIDSQPILLADEKYAAGDKKSLAYYYPYINQLTHRPLTNISLGDSVNLRNCLNLEEDIFEIIESYKRDFQKVTPEIVEYEEMETKNAETIIFAHGIVAAAARVAVERLRENGVKVGLFRPITLRPFPTQQIRRVIKNTKRLIVTESALGQFGGMIKEALYGQTDIPIATYYRPALGITPEMLVDKVMEIEK